MPQKRSADSGEPAAKKSKGGQDAVNVLMVGTGEYTTGYVGGKAADSDKGAGVVGLVMMDLRSKGKTDRLAMAGVNGTKFPGIRAHMQRNIGDVCVPQLDTQGNRLPPAAARAPLPTCGRSGVRPLALTPPRHSTPPQLLRLRHLLRQLPRREDCGSQGLPRGPQHVLSGKRSERLFSYTVLTHLLTLLDPF